ncbi:MAG TPA: hypothetical protein VFM90_05025, partial [Cyclobacteriaceae bacterium]|nr:hypothetical protein [Cyclobacteriaceae bacterium]
MRFHRFLVAIFLATGLLVPAGAAYAQQLMGLVVERNASGVDEPIPGANVFWLGTSTGVTTSENGVFLI